MILKIIITLFLFFTIVPASQVQLVESFALSKHTKKVTHKKRKRKKHRSLKRIRKKYSKPKVVIIIDDISHKWQLNKLHSLPFKVTPSIFPPSKMNMNSHLLARGLKHYLVHLPLESKSKKLNSMYKTLFSYDSAKKIEQRVQEIRRLFPTARYVNNHTGSVFTQNYKASKRLYNALNKQGFIFVDSRTTKRSVIPKIAQQMHKRYLKSDLFIDNTLNTNTIMQQIKKGLQEARKRGYVVMIGHPHPQTFRALKRIAKDLKHYNVIYLDEL